MFPITLVTNKAARAFALVCLLALASVSVLAAGGSQDLVISQVYGGGGATTGSPTYKYDYIEIFNRSNSPVTMTGYSLQYGSATGTGNWNVHVLPTTTVAPGQYILVREGGATAGADLPVAFDISDGLNLSASSGKVALVKGTAALSGACPVSTNIVDLVGFGTANCSETAATPTLDNTHAAVRNNSGCADTDNNAVDLVSVLAPVPHNSQSPLNLCQGSQNPVGAGAASPTTVDVNSSVLLTVAVTPGAYPTSTGIAVKGDLTAIGGSATQAFFDDGTNGDLVPGDNIFSYSAIVPASVAAGSKTVTATISDAQLRTASAPISFSVNPPPPPVVAIHDVQGSQGKSLYVGQQISVVGIVTGVKSNGFFLQAPDSESDGDPNTSEGIYIYTSSKPGAAVVLGAQLMVSGTVSEYQPSGSVVSITELGPSVTIKSLSAGNPLPTAVTLAASDTDPSGPANALQKYESMRVHVDSVTTVGPTGGSKDEKNAKSTSNGAFWAVITGVGRPFREPGVTAGSDIDALVPAGAPRFDGNPERLLVDSDALGGKKLDLTSNAVVANFDGVMDLSSSYAIDMDATASPTVSGVMSSMPVRVAGEREFAVASFNMERFYNATADDAGAVTLAAAAYANRLSKASLIIRNVLHMPDIIGVEEVENLPTLQEIANKVNADAAALGQPNPNYQPYLEQGNDPSAIDVGILVKKDRVNVQSVTQVGKDAIYIDPRDGSNDVLNDRPSLVMKASLIPPKGQPFPVTFIVNHLRSMSGYDTNDPAGLYAREKRRQQAEFLAQLIAEHQNAGENVISVGDYNAYQFNDGLTDVVGTVMGAPASPDQVLAPTSDFVDPNLVDLIDQLPSSDRYTYVEAGNAQALDHVIVSQSLLPRLAGIEVARNNADFPEAWRGDPTRPERMSDHDIPVAYFSFPPPQADLAVAVSGPTTLVSGQASSYTATVTNSGPDAAEKVTLVNAVPAGVTVDVVAPATWTCAQAGQAMNCTTDSLESGASAQFTFAVTAPCATVNGTSLVNGIGVTSDTVDPNSANNTQSQTWSVSNPAPVISSLSLSTKAIWPPNHKMIPVSLSYSVTDNCDATIVPVVSVSSNEPANASGDGNTDVDWIVVNNKLVQLRAERSGSGSGRVYTINVAATDSAGGSTSKSAQVVVPHN